MKPKMYKVAFHFQITQAHGLVFTSLAEVAVFLEALALDEDIYENGEYSSMIEEN